MNGVARLGIIGAVLVAAGGGLLLKQATAPGRVSSGEIPFDPAAPIELEPVRNACGGTMADKRLAVLAGILSAVAAVSPLRGDTEPAEVRAVLFYSPECPHCHEVMDQYLPPLLLHYGESLRIAAVNVDTPEGQALYRAAVLHFQLKPDRLGVPALVLGNHIMVGSGEIPSQFPGLVDAALAGDGMDWPPIPDIRSYFALHGILATGGADLTDGGRVVGAETVVRILGRDGDTAARSVAGRFMRDPAGNAIAVAVLLAMVTVLALSVRAVLRADRPLQETPVWVIPAFAAAGLAIALYMAFVEVTGSEAVCGPVGDCNRVQSSPYATLAGVPVGVFGVIGYLLLGVIRVGWRRHPRQPLLVWGIALAGVAFSIYLTFLEPFVIGATCLWCINSAVIMTLILVAATPAAVRDRRHGRTRFANAHGLTTSSRSSAVRNRPRRGA